jgi:hypothetical protein
MGMKAKLKKMRLQAEQAAVGAGRCLLWDSELPGFGARISRQRITFVLNYWHGALERRMTLGTLAEFGTGEAARKHAAQIKLQVRAGNDPLGEVRAKRSGGQGGITLTAVVDQWIAASRAGWSAQTQRTYRTNLRKHVLPKFGDRDVESISLGEWSALLRSIRTSKPGTATLLLRTISSALNWARDEQMLSAVNLPSAKRTAPKVAPRTRVVTDDEIVTIWAASDALDAHQRAFARFIIPKLCSAIPSTAMKWPRLIRSTSSSGKPNTPSMPGSGISRGWWKGARRT